MNFTFNLIDEKWIPCITSERKFIDVSLRDLFAEAHKIREISCETPIQSAAILPLALAILHRNFGPASAREWGKLWKAGKFDMERLDTYFEEWHERFDLFHPKRPFYQVKDDRVQRKPALYLAESIKNTHTLFNHVTEENAPSLSPARAARTLLQAQAFRLGGGRSGRDTPNAVHSIFVGSVLFFARGESLFKTLMLNLIRYPDEGFMPTTAKDEPYWERDVPIQIGKQRLKLAPAGYLDYLTWQTNHVQLFFDTDKGGVTEITIVPVAELIEAVRSPQKLYKQKLEKKKITYKPLPFRSEKALWRDYHSLLPQDSNDYLPAAIRWCARLVKYGQLEDSHVIQLMATGMRSDKAKPIFYRREVMLLPLELLRNAKYAADIEGALGKAEEVAGKLRNALNTLAEHVLQRGAEGKPDPGNRRNLVKQWNALERFWIELEPRFWEFIKALVKDSDQARGQWQDDLKRIARQSLAHAISLAGDTPWAWKGGIAAQRQLQAGMNKALN